MASVNKIKPIYTHGGAKASHIKPLQKLERSVMSCMLFEDSFYESGVKIGIRIKDLVKENDPEDVLKLALKAKNDMCLRHVPLLLVREVFRNKSYRKMAGETLYNIISRPDDLTEFLALYWHENKDEPLAKQAKVALGRAFHKFDEYQLAKYNGGNKAIKLVDVLRIVHPKKSELLGKLRRGELTTPDTWEVELSRGRDKKESWTRLLQDKKLGGLAMLRNIRNMTQANVDSLLIKSGIQNLNATKLLPINFVSAAKHNPQFEPQIEEKFFDCFTNQKKLSGKTILIIDISGSMNSKLSAKSELNRLDVASSLAMITREVCEEPIIYCTAGNDYSRIHATALIPARRGFALADYIKGGEANHTLGCGGIFLVQCMEFIRKAQNYADRIIVLTDEQDCDQKLLPENADAFGKNNYLINISSEKNGIGYRKWLHIDGWSDKIINYIMQHEQQV